MADSVATPFWKNTSNILLAVGCALIIVITGWMSSLTQRKDQGQQIKTELAGVSVITIILCAVFGFAAYVYFSSYPAYLTNFILVISFINLALSVFAVSVATINVTTT